tara:strand:+ start:261 stop:2024 length:1764 start_codon:yes stop_codon:yes gene_type:complete
MGTNSGLTDEYIETILKNFKGNDETFAVQPKGHSFAPRVLNDDLSVEEFRTQHLGGDNCIGIYVLNKESNVHMSCVDFDSHPDNPDPAWVEKTEQLFVFLEQQGLEPFVEISASGVGSHVWLLFEPPVEAWIPRAFFTAVSNHLDIPMPEIYPRQDRLTGKGLGNLVRLPYYNNSHFVDISDDWSPTLPDFKYTDVAELKVITSRLGIRLKPLTVKQDKDDVHPAIKKQMANRPTGLLSRRWEGDLEGLKDRSKSACALSLTVAMLDEYMHPDDIDQALVLWGEKHSYNKANREDFRQGCIARAYELKQTPKHTSSKPTGDFRECALASLLSMKEGNYIPFGIPPIDAAIDGISKGEMALIMARPGHGKSAIGAQWIEHAAKCGRPALMLNAEMSPTEVGKRSLMKITGVTDEQDYIENRDEYAALVEAYYAGWTPPHFRNVSSIDDVEREVRAFKSGYNIEAVVIDYVQLLRSNKATRYEQVSDISLRLKSIAREEDIAMIALCQASRSIEKRDKIEFLASDLKESGQLEQDADLVAGLYWWGRSNNPRAEVDKADFHFIKRRNGPIRKHVVRVKFEAEKQLFSEI